MAKEQIEKKAEELGIKYQTPCHGVGDCEFEARQAAIEMADWLRSHQWVSVEDELPPKKDGDNDSEYVFASLTCGRLPWTACYSYDHQCWMDVNHQSIHSVTHWMPIPPLAEEGGKDEI